MAKSKKQFEKFHSENPKVYELFKYFTMQVRNAGFHKYSAEAVLNQIRWYTTIETRGDDFKINNDYKPYYSRMYMNEHNVDIFRTRSSIADMVDLQSAKLWEGEKRGGLNNFISNGDNRRNS